MFKALKNDLKDLNIYIWSGLITFYVGIFDEVIQWRVPNRVGAIEDVWLNTKSGILALMLIGLVIRPGEIETKFYLRNLKEIYIPISLALVTSGVFINFIHDFGYKIKVNASIEIFSHFPENELRLINKLLQRDLLLLKKTVQRFEGIDNLSNNIISIREAKALAFFKEAAGHKWERDYSFSKKRFLKTLNEQIILKKYYSSAFYFDSFKWGREKEYFVKRLSQQEEKGGKGIYKSPVCGILITEFSKIQMWIFIGITNSIFIFLFINTKR